MWDEEELQCAAPRHDNVNADTPFIPLKKSTLYKFKKQVSGKDKRAVSIVYDHAAQSGNEDNDYGDLPRSKKQLIDLSRSPFVDNEVGDKSILWHHSGIPEDLWVIGTNDIAFEMSKVASFFLFTQRLTLVFLMSFLSHAGVLCFSASQRMLHKNEDNHNSA